MTTKVPLQWLEAVEEALAKEHMMSAEREWVGLTMWRLGAKSGSGGQWDHRPAQKLWEEHGNTTASTWWLLMSLMPRPLLPGPLNKWRRSLASSLRACRWHTLDPPTANGTLWLLSLLLLKSAGETVSLTASDLDHFNVDPLIRQIFLEHSPSGLQQQFEVLASAQDVSGHLDRLACIEIGLAMSSSCHRRQLFRQNMEWFLEKRSLWSSETPVLLCAALALHSSRLEVVPGQTQLQDLVKVDHDCTKLVCPICGCQLGPSGETEDDAECKLHGAVRLVRMGQVESARALALAAFAEMWFSPRECSELLEVVCAVCHLSILRQVHLEEVQLALRTGKVPYDSSSRAAFERWFADKHMRVMSWPTVRSRCSLQIRELWQRHGREGRPLEAALAKAREDAAPVLAKQDELEKLIISCQKAIAGLETFIKGSVDAEAVAVRQGKILEKQEKCVELNRELEFVKMDPALCALEKATHQWQEFWARTGLESVSLELNDYNTRLAAVRTGSIGREGLMFEHECLSLVEDMFQKDDQVRILRGVQLRGVQFPERATSEFDFWVCRGNEVLEIIEMKRSSSAIRGNLLKKRAALHYLLSAEFKGTAFEGMDLTSSSFRLFQGESFSEHMWFFAREPVKVHPGEDVFGMFLDNEEGYLMCLTEILDDEILSPAFIDKSYALIQERFPMTEDDVREYKEGTEAFCKVVQSGRVRSVQHIWTPEQFGLPIRHKSALNNEDE